METASAGPVQMRSAELYHRMSVPALYGQFAPHVVEQARLRPGHQVLDVACGTGVVTAHAYGRVAPTGHVVGLDPDPSMLAVAARHVPDVEWRNGHAERLPFVDERFHAVTCQFGLVQFHDGDKALRQMRRVLKPWGRLVLAVWAGIGRCPAYQQYATLVERLLGVEAARAARSPFVFDDRDRLIAKVQGAGFDDVDVFTIDGIARFPSLAHWMRLESVMTLAGHVDEAGRQRLTQTAERDLRRFAREDGTVAFPIATHLVTARA